MPLIQLKTAAAADVGEAAAAAGLGLVCRRAQRGCRQLKMKNDPRALVSSP